MKNGCAVALVVAAGAMASGVGAQAPPSEIERICAGERNEFALPAFERFDADGNGAIEATETAACQALNELFSRLDLDSSGELSREEYSAFADLWQRHARSLGAPE